MKMKEKSNEYVSDVSLLVVVISFVFMVDSLA